MINTKMFKRNTSAFSLFIFGSLLTISIQMNKPNLEIEIKEETEELSLNTGVSSEIFEVSIENNNIDTVMASYEDNSNINLEENLNGDANNKQQEKEEYQKQIEAEIIEKKAKEEVQDQEQIKTIQETRAEEERLKNPPYFRISDEEKEYVRNYSCNVPNGTDGCKSYAYTYMDYRKVTSRNTINYKTLNCDEAWTDQVTGIRMVGERMCVAVGSGFGVSAGDKIDIELKNGSIFKCIVGDEKADEHTDSSNKFHMVDGSVVEIIVDTDIFKGTYMYPEELKGPTIKVVSIKE